MTLRGEARSLALRLNGGERGILADEDAPGCVLERESAAPPGAVPLWGQKGAFIVTVAGMRVRVALHGVFGIGSWSGFWPGFAAHAVDWDKPFLSETGYRSFLGIYAPPCFRPDARALRGGGDRRPCRPRAERPSARHRARLPRVRGRGGSMRKPGTFMIEDIALVVRQTTRRQGAW